MTCDAKSIATAIGGRLSPFSTVMAGPTWNPPRTPLANGITTGSRRFQRGLLVCRRQRGRSQIEHFLRRRNQFGGQCSGALARCQSWQSGVFRFLKAGLTSSQPQGVVREGRLNGKAGHAAGVVDLPINSDNTSEQERHSPAIHNHIQIRGLCRIGTQESNNVNMAAIESCVVWW